jgi:hypothetical protein
MSVTKKVRTTVRRTARIESALDSKTDEKYTATVNVRNVMIRNRSGWGLEFPRTKADAIAFYDLAAAVLQEILDAETAAE